jgi:hypothetical protein
VSTHTIHLIKTRSLIKPVSLLVITAFCLFKFVLRPQSNFLREFEMVMFQVEWMLLICIVIWCSVFLFLIFDLNDLLLICLLLVAIAACFIGDAASLSTNVITLLFGVMLGKSAFILLQRDKDGNGSEFRIFLVGLVALLTFSSWWHLDIATGNYHGPRWMGLWDNPNTYGMLMGVVELCAVLERIEMV